MNKNSSIPSKTLLLRKHALFVIICLLLSVPVFGQAGYIDSTFNSGDMGFGLGDGANNVVYSIIVQPDSKILIGGAFSTYNGTTSHQIARLNTDGTLDTSFKPATEKDGVIRCMAVQSDGKILIGGFFSVNHGTTWKGIIRLNTDGGLDSSFSTGQEAIGNIYSIVIQSDGKILIGGQFNTNNGNTRNIARLNIDGSLDTGFNLKAGASESVNAIAIQNDGKILIGGFFTTYNGAPRMHIARLNANGTLDTSFKPGQGTNYPVESITIQNDKQILIGGIFSIYNGNTIMHIARLNTDGTLDSSFDPGPGIGSDEVKGIVIQNDGKILAGGFFANSTGNAGTSVIRMDTNGNRDTSFHAGTDSNVVANSIAIQNNGKIVVGEGIYSAYKENARKHIALLNTDGSLDPGFNPGNGADNTINTIALQTDGKILIGGLFTGYNGIAVRRIARLNMDGSFDTGFDSGKGTDGSINSIAVQTDGKILIGGSFNHYNGNLTNYIARLNTDGSLDTNFKPVIRSGITNAIVIQDDGKILIAGNFGIYQNGTIIYNLARLNADGSLDTGFNPGIAGNSIIFSIVIQSDKKILVAGDSFGYNGLARECIIRLNTDGSLDTGFKAMAQRDTYFIKSAAVQGDGKIVAGINFTSYSGTAKNLISRLNADGSADTTFYRGQGANDYVASVVPQNNGKILIGGYFTTYNGVARNGIARLNENGSLDTTFKQGAGANDSINSITLQVDGKILIGGSFTAYKSTGKNRVARILNTSINMGITEYKKINISIYPNPNNGTFTIETDAGGTYSILNSLGEVIRVFQLNADQTYISTIQNLDNGVYFLTSNDKKLSRQKIVVIR